MFETDYLPFRAQYVLDEGRQIDLPHVSRVVVRHDNGEILGQHHEDSQIAMIDVLVGHKDGIQRRELRWRQLDQLGTVGLKEETVSERV